MICFGVESCSFFWGSYSEELLKDPQIFKISPFFLSFDLNNQIDSTLLLGQSRDLSLTFSSQHHSQHHSQHFLRGLSFGSARRTHRERTAEPPGGQFLHAQLSGQVKAGRLEPNRARSRITASIRTGATGGRTGRSNGESQEVERGGRTGSRRCFHGRN